MRPSPCQSLNAREWIFCLDKTVADCSFRFGRVKHPLTAGDFSSPRIPQHRPRAASASLVASHVRFGIPASRFVWLRQMSEADYLEVTRTCDESRLEASTSRETTYRSSGLEVPCLAHALLFEAHEKTRLHGILHSPCVEQRWVAIASIQQGLRV